MKQADDKPRQLGAIRREFEEALHDGHYDTAEAIAQANPDLDLWMGRRWMVRAQTSGRTLVKDAAGPPARERCACGQWHCYRDRTAELERHVAALEQERQRDALDGQAALDEANNRIVALQAGLRQLMPLLGLRGARERALALVESLLV